MVEIPDVPKCGNPEDCFWKSYIGYCFNVCKTEIKCEYIIKQ